MKKLFFSVILCGLLSNAIAQHPSIGGYSVFYGHIHNHSNYSDGTGTPSQAYSYAKNTAGLDFFGLGDHAEQLTSTEYSSTISTANSYNEDGVFTTFYGFEWSSSNYGHIYIGNSDDYCTSTQSSTNTFDELLTWLSSRDCIAFFNHPGRQDGSGTEFDHFSDTPSDKFVGIELWNKSNGFTTYYYNDGYYSGDNDLGYWDEGLVRDWKLGASGSGDNHSGTWGTANDYRMAILADTLTRSALYSAMEDRRFYSTLDKNIALSFKLGGSEMGSTVDEDSLSLQILASDGNTETFTQVRLFKDGILEQTWNVNTTSVSISSTISTTDGEFYYVIVTQNDGDEAISSPIWVSEDESESVSSLMKSSSEDNTVIKEVEEQDVPISLEVYPNPVEDGTIYINTAGTMQVKIIDIMNNTLISETVTGGLTTVDVSDLTPGIYIVVLSDEENVFKETIIVK